jgi:hypothetical protein
MQTHAYTNGDDKIQKRSIYRTLLRLSDPWSILQKWITLPPPRTFISDRAITAHSKIFIYFLFQTTDAPQNIYLFICLKRDHVKLTYMHFRRCIRTCIRQHSKKHLFNFYFRQRHQENYLFILPIWKCGGGG